MTTLQPTSKPKPARLTREQSRQVKELIEDSGMTRAEAVAWVRVFEVKK